MILDYSYGIIPLQKHEDAWQVLLIQHSTAGFWGFPKGHADGGELPQEAAVRELKEETNLDVTNFLSDSMLKERYQFTFQGKRIDKTVGYFVAEVEGNLILQDQEVSDSKWLPLDEAADLLTYDTDKAVLNSAKNLIVTGRSP